MKNPLSRTPGSALASWLRQSGLIGLAVLTLGLALAPFAGQGTPGDSIALSVTVAALASVLVVAMRAPRAGSVDIVGLPAIAGAAFALSFVPPLDGFSPYLFLPVLAGYLLGVRYGFAAGAVAAVAAGSIGFQLGPWLPYQALAAGWMGALAGAVGQATGRGAGLKGRLGMGAAALVGAYVYGILMNATIWTGFFAGGAQAGWGPSVPMPLGVAHFAGFYVLTALPWDTLRGLGLAGMAVVLPWQLLLRVRWLGPAPRSASGTTPVV